MSCALFRAPQHGSKVFAYFYGMFNIYVLLLAFCYTPAGALYGDINTNENVRRIKSVCDDMVDSYW